MKENFNLRRKSKTKKQCQVIHAKRRAFERYGLELNHAKYREMLLAFQHLTDYGFIDRHHTIVRKISNRMTVHDFPYNDTIYRIVYDKMRKVIVTFLPIHDESELTEEEILQEEENGN